MKPLVSPEIEAYAEWHSEPESDVCRAIREETERTMASPQMLVGPLEGAFLKMMIRLVGAKRVLEIGTFTGYSALSMAEALPKGGSLMTCEIDAKAAAVARKHIGRSAQAQKIEILMGPALDTVKALSGPFDVIFIDADKVNYVHYYRRALELLSPSGVILIDNVLWSGDVLLQPPPDPSTATIQKLNRLVASDPRVTAVLVTVRDGILIVRKRASANGA